MVQLQDDLAHLIRSILDSKRSQEEQRAFFKELLTRLSDATSLKVDTLKNEQTTLISDSGIGIDAPDAGVAY